MSPEYKGTTNENGAEFSYPGGSGCVLIFVGLLGLSILGFVYYRFNGVWPGWDMLEGLDYTLLEVGSLFTIAGLSLYFAGTDDAHTVIFDNTRDTVRIEKKNPSVATPYQDMVGFPCDQSVVRPHPTVCQYTIMSYTGIKRRAVHGILRPCPQ